MLPVDRTLADFAIDDILHILRYGSPFDWNYLPSEGDVYSLKYDGVDLMGFEYHYTKGDGVLLMKTIRLTTAIY